MSYPAWGTAPIKCGKRKCDWTGKETDLKEVPFSGFKDCTKNVCPKCGCDSYEFVKVKESK